jgi:hypothetical protein
MRFNDFCSLATNLRAFENTFSIEISDPRETCNLY